MSIRISFYIKASYGRFERYHTTLKREHCQMILNKISILKCETLFDMWVQRWWIKEYSFPSRIFFLDF